MSVRVVPCTPLIERLNMIGYCGGGYVTHYTDRVPG